MKIDTSDLVAGVTLIATAVGFYFVGRYHDDYLKEKAATAEATPAEEPAVEVPTADEPREQL